MDWFGSLMTTNDLHYVEPFTTESKARWGERYEYYTALLIGLKFNTG